MLQPNHFSAMIHLSVTLLLLTFFHNLFLSNAFASNHRGIPPVIGTPPPKCMVIDDIILPGPIDPGMTGPFSVVREIYDFGDNAANLPGFDFPVELRAEVTYPEELECGPFPIVFILHGKHANCLSGDLTGASENQWPCEEGDIELPNYLGFRYFTDKLASQGIIAVSVGANGISTADNKNLNTLDARSQLLQQHLQLWRSFSTLGAAPFDTQFVKKVDLKRIGVMGHSRGGLGSARFVDAVNSPANKLGFLTSNGPKPKVSALLLLGSVEGDSLATHQVTNTALASMLPYCDGDQDQLPGVIYFDASRYALVNDNAAKHSFTVVGANHNYYNVLWDDTLFPIPQAKDDWFDGVSNDGGPLCQLNDPDSHRLTSSEQQGTLIAIGAAFFRTYLQNDKRFLSFLNSESEPPPSAKTDEIYVAYHPRGGEPHRLDINRMTLASNTETNTLNGDAFGENLLRYEFCSPNQDLGPMGCVTDHLAFFITAGRIPHAQSTESAANLLRLAWNSGSIEETARYVNTLPEPFRDLSRFEAIQFRAFVDPTDALNPFMQPQDLRIVLTDGAGLDASVRASDFTRSLLYPPGVLPYTEDELPIPRAILHTIRIPLSAFQNLFLSDIHSVELVFDETTSGAISVADLAVADASSNPAPQVSCSTDDTHLTATGDQLVNVGLTVDVEGNTFTPPSVFVYSDEDDEDSENKQHSPDAKDIANNTLRLRAEQDNNEDGRVYLITALSDNSDSLSGFDCCAVTVTKNNSPAAMESVSQQATDALMQCAQFAAAAKGLTNLPDGFVVVGDGPIIGNKQ